jgi:hypothetical protein
MDVSLVSVVCCHEEFSARGRSLVQGSPTDCGVLRCETYKPRAWGRPLPRWAVALDANYDKYKAHFLNCSISTTKRALKLLDKSDHKIPKSLSMITTHVSMTFSFVISYHSLLKATKID